MIKYYARVFFISHEALLLSLSYVLYLFFGNNIQAYFKEATLNEDAIKWLTAIPIILVGWTLNEARKVIFPDEKGGGILNEWPDYWKLKAHFYVGCSYCVLFTLPCLYIWLLGDIKKFHWFWLHITLVLALLVNAGSFYLAIADIKSILIKSK